jgi:adenine-specific DNA-methyltransferase
MADDKKSEAKRQIESYEHRDKERVNNPPVGLVTPDTDPDAGQEKKRYAYDPHLAPELNFDARKVRDELSAEIERGLAAQTLDEAKAALAKLKKAQEPFLNWAGKAEHTSFEVPTVSLHVHERIDPRTIIEAVRKKNGNGQPEQLGLFEEERNEPLREAIEFYRHKHGWTNRLIAGDSLLVMNSLLEKEGMAGKVQMIYIDPPYGIKYGSNFQPFVNKRDVKDGKDEDLTAEPEQIRAFRDTWELGIHSYLTYLRDRLLLARELLHESGSIFVQISDENVHHVRELMDEVFGRQNFVGLITFRKIQMPLGAKFMEGISDYLLWYAKDKPQMKYHQLFLDKIAEGKSVWGWVQLPSGERRRLSSDEIHRNDLLPAGARVFRLQRMKPAGFNPSCVFDVEFAGRVYGPPYGSSWVTNREGVTRIIRAELMMPTGNNLNYIQFHDDYSVMPLTNVWMDTGGPSEKLFAVQTVEKVIERCLLMTTDPGDLVFDPTCGSGTTAYVAEKWGRRWITCDTSRVAITIARQRLMTAVFDYYNLAHPEEGVGSGFKYKTVPHVTLKSIANNPEIDGIYARMHPAIERALAELNAALRALPPTPSPTGRGSEGNPLPAGEGGRRPGEGYPRFKVTQGGRAGQFVDFAAPDSATFTMPSGQVVKVNELVEWEVPFEFPADWPEEARPAFERFHQARRAMQKAMDEAIARHAPQETLYDQPLVDRKKVRVTGPFTVEAVPAPVVKSVDEILPSPLPSHSGSVPSSHPSPSGRGSTPSPQPSPTGRGSEDNPLPAGEGGRRPGEGDTGQRPNESKKPLDPELLEFARQLRKQQTDAEQLLWSLLRDRRLSGFKFRRQHPVEPYVVDFYCHEARLAVELDGGQHNEPDERARDAKRTSFLEKQGIRVLRFWNNDVLQNTEGVLQAIYDTLVSLTPSLSQGERELALTPALSLREKEYEADASIARSGETLRQAEWRDELLKTGIRGKAGQYIRFARLEPLPGCRWLHAEGETRPNDEGSDSVREPQAKYMGQIAAPAYEPMRVVVSFGPEHGPLEQRQVALALDEAQTLVPRPKLIIFAAFQFDPEAAKDIDETRWPGVTLLRVQMNADLLTEDLKKKRASNESFWLIGQPDVEVRKEKDGKYVVEVHGFDYYNTKTGQVESGAADKIAVWMLDTDYDGRSLYPRQVFFPMAGENEGWAKLARTLKAEIDEDLIEAYRGTVSLPFAAGEHKRIAVKIVDDRGIESLKVMALE